MGEFKFGDIIENEWASGSNPRRKGIFIRYSGKTIELTDMVGNFWNTYNNKDSKNKKIGNILLPTPAIDEGKLGKVLQSERGCLGLHRTQVGAIATWLVKNKSKWLKEGEEANAYDNDGNPIKYDVK
jgi:hypothetical protein